MSSQAITQDTQTAVKQEIKDLKAKCTESYNIIRNNVIMEMQGINLDNIEEKSSSYVDGLRAAIENTETPVITDTNRITSEFLTETHERIGQIKELCAFEQGIVLDLSAEIDRLKTQIHIAEEAKAKQKPQKTEIQPMHIQKAKHMFRTMRAELHALIQALYPSFAEQLMEILAELMTEKMTEGSPGYIEITPERFQVLELLRDIGIVTPNPYNKREVKLAY